MKRVMDKNEFADKLFEGKLSRRDAVKTLAAAGLVATTVVLVLIGLIAALLAASIETVNHTRRELRAIEPK